MRRRKQPPRGYGWDFREDLSSSFGEILAVARERSRRKPIQQKPQLPERKVI